MFACREEWTLIKLKNIIKQGKWQRFWVPKRLSLLPRDARNIYNFHKAFLRLEKRVCVYDHPRCEKCVLTDICNYYKEAAL